MVPAGTGNALDSPIGELTFGVTVRNRESEARIQAELAPTNERVSTAHSRRLDVEQEVPGGTFAPLTLLAGITSLFNDSPES